MDPIPEEVLAREHRRFLRRIAALIAQAMAETDLGFEDLDRRLGKPKGWAQRQMNRYLTCRTSEGRMATDLACALGVRIELNFRSIEAMFQHQQEAGSEEPE